MADNYFNYIIHNCSKRPRIRLCCNEYNSMQDFIYAVNSEFNGYTDSSCDRLIINAVYDTFRGRILNRLYLSNSFTDDALLIYNRCKTGLEKLKEIETIDHEFMFDVMTDYCWLRASIKDCLSRKKTLIILLDQPNIIRLKLRNYLSDVYNNALYDKKVCLRINESIDAKKGNVRGARDYYNNSIPELEQIYIDVQNSKNEKMAVFFGLTVTNLLADEINRGIK